MIYMKLFWLDLETTSLDPLTGRILELAVAEADLGDPFEIGPILNRVLRFGQTTDRVPDPVVLDMHAKSGLLAECSESTLTVADVEGELLDLVPEVADKDDRPVLAGFGVHFDHGFLRVHMPRLAARLHYRHYDVTPVGFFCRSLGMGKIPKAHAHRAREDVLESIEYARKCADWLTSHGRRRSSSLGLLSSFERRDLADILGINYASTEAVRAGYSQEASDSMWSGMSTETQVGLLVEWLVSRAAATYGRDNAVEQLAKHIALLRGEAH